MSKRKILNMSLIDFLVRSEWGRPRYVYSAIFIIGIVLIWLGTHSSPCLIADPYSFLCLIASDKFVKEVGVAFVIAAFVGSTVDAYNLRRHELEREETSQQFVDLGEQITKKVAEDAVRHGALTFFPSLSSTIIGATQRQVLQAQITRENYQIQVELENEASKTYLLANISIEYTLRNDTDAPVLYDFSFGFEPEFQGGLERETTPQYVKIASEEFNGVGEMERGALIQRSGTRISKLFKKIVVPAKTAVDVVVEFTENRGFDDCIYWVMTIPSDKLSLTLKPCAGLEYSADSLHPFDAEEPEPSTRRFRHFRHLRSRPKSKTWEIQKGLLPGQGILLRWHCN
jgi:hypothetical protein